jgi:hypothetical protein
MVSIEEHDPRGDGLGGAWVVRPAPYQSYIAADWVAPWHRDTYAISFADGHSEVRRFLDPLSHTLWAQGSMVLSTNADWQWLWARAVTW